MKTRIVEATNGPNNWGKFLIGQLDTEWERESVVDPGKNLLQAIGWDPAGRTLMVMDLQTREGAVFRIGGYARGDLDEKHRIWVCPLFEPFLTWLYANFTTLEALPECVDLPDAEFSFFGFRRSGGG